MNDVNMQTLPVPTMRTGLTVQSGFRETPETRQPTNDPHKLATDLLRRLDRMLPTYLERLAERAQQVMRGQASAGDAERAQQVDDAELVALRRLAERLQRGGPLV